MPAAEWQNVRTAGIWLIAHVGPLARRLSWYSVPPADHVTDCCLPAGILGLLERHADLVLGAAADALHGHGPSRSAHNNGGGGAVKQVLRRLLQVRCRGPSPHCLLSLGTTSGHPSAPSAVCHRAHTCP